MNAIEKLQNELYEGYEASSLSPFVRWWKTEIKSFIPKQYHEKLFPKAIEILLVQDNENVKVWNNINNSYEQSAESDNEKEILESWWKQVQNIINQADGKKVEVKYLLPNETALIRKIALPSGAKENLDEVIGFELDKYVPFSADQVQVSYKIDAENQDESKLLLDLVVIPKQNLVDVLNACDEKSIKLDGIDVNTASNKLSPKYIGVNLLPKDQRKVKDYFNLKLNAGLILILVALIYFIMHTSIENKKQKIENLTNINSELQKQAKESKLLKRELKSVIVSSKFLHNMKSDHPEVVTLLSEITSKLPDTTYLSKVKINQSTLEVSGLSDNANILIPILDKSTNWYVPQIKGSILPDSSTNKEKFTIEANLNEPQEEGANGQT